MINSSITVFISIENAASTESFYICNNDSQYNRTRLAQFLILFHVKGNLFNFWRICEKITANINLWLFHDIMKHNFEAHEKTDASS